MAHSYLDFELEIGIGQGREYPVAVLRSPAGEARATMHFPFDELVLENRILTLEKVLLRSGGKRRLALSNDEQVVLDFGRSLFDALLTDDVRSLYYESHRLADQGGDGLRLKLRFAAPALAALPWEFLYDARRAEYVCLSVNTPLVRYLERPQPPRVLTVQPPLRILGMIVSPTDLQDLDLERERTRLERAIEPLRARGLVEVTWLEGQTWRDLQREMRHGPWHIFHFAGHGSFDANADEGMVMLADDKGHSHPFRATELGRLLADHKPLRLAVLNACEGGRGSERDIFSSTASILVQRGLPAVLAMQYEITDRAAVELTRAFYEALADGLPVDAAVAEARKAVSMEVVNTFEWGTPVLFMRAPDGILFELSEHRVTPVIKPQEPPKVIVITEPICIELVRVPAGEFLMGTPPENLPRLVKEYGGNEEWFKDETPQQCLFVPNFYIAKYPVTVEQFDAFVRATGYQTDAEREGYGWAWTGGEFYKESGASWRHPRGPKSDVKDKVNHPVTQVTWQDAQAFCRWAKVRLPSEPEWEKAARGVDGRAYPWGNQAPSEKLCNFGDKVGGTSAVGEYPDGASPYGALDMAGNVWEWCSSEYKNYPYRVDDGRENLTESVLRVLRGGSSGSAASSVRCADRGSDLPHYRDVDRGFRVGWAFPAASGL